MEEAGGLHPNSVWPRIEDRRTLWLLHWQLATHSDDPLFAWDYLLNRWHRLELSPSSVLESFLAETRGLARPLSRVTLEQHLDVFLHTYVPTNGPKGIVLEDNLDSPLVELNFVQLVGERTTAGSGHREPVYAFRRDAKPDITADLFAYCLDGYWSTRRASAETLSFRDITVGAGSPGRVFQLSEWDVRDRLTTIERDTQGAFRYEDSAAHPRLVRGGGPVPSLAAIYKRVERA